MDEFRTDQLAIAPYLMLNGLKYLRSEISLGKHDKPVVVFVFEDPHGVGKDLELDFVKSNYKQYRDLLFFFRNEIEKLMRKVDKINTEEKIQSQSNEDENEVKEG